MSFEHSTARAAPGDRVYLNSKQVRQRYGDISDMSLWRWQHDDDLGFPAPLVIQRRRYWRLDDLDAFDEAQAARRTGIDNDGAGAGNPEALARQEREVVV